MAIPRAGLAVAVDDVREAAVLGVEAGSSVSGVIVEAMPTFRNKRSPAKDPGTPSHAELPPWW